MLFSAERRLMAVSWSYVSLRGLVNYSPEVARPLCRPSRGLVSSEAMRFPLCSPLGLAVYWIGTALRTSK